MSRKTAASPISTTIAREADGTVQLNLSIPQSVISHTQEHVIEEMGQGMTIPGFRKGKAPIEKIREKIKEDALIQNTLNHILPNAFWEAVETHKIKPAIYPKFEVKSLGADADWQVTAFTCELPEVEVAKYKGIKLSGKTKEDKETEVLKSLLETTKITIPKILAEEELNNRLTGLLNRIEKLGLSLDSYLTRTYPDLTTIEERSKKLREDYEKQVVEAVSLELILNKIADLEKIEAKEEEIAEMVKNTGIADNEQQRRIISSILRRRAVLDLLVSES